MQKVMFSLPDTLVSRMRAVIPDGERSRLLSELLEKVVKDREQKLYESALLLESDAGLRKEMQQWDESFINDGLDNV